MYAEHIKTADRILAPDMFIPELTNALWKYVRVKILTQDEGQTDISMGINYIDDFIDSKSLWFEAFLEAVRNNHPVYDMLYMVAARRNGATLLTNDGRLAAICKDNHVDCVI
jgi:predicted nucleic acid-binding protein